MTGVLNPPVALKLLTVTVVSLAETSRAIAPARVGGTDIIRPGGRDADGEIDVIGGSATNQLHVELAIGAEIEGPFHVHPKRHGDRADTAAKSLGSPQGHIGGCYLRPAPWPGSSPGRHRWLRSD